MENFRENSKGLTLLFDLNWLILRFRILLEKSKGLTLLFDLKLTYFEMEHFP